MTALVLLPGMDGTGQLFREFVSMLDKGIRPIVVSYPESEPLGYQELEIYARKYLPENEPFVLLGESFSGPVAISLAASNPAGLIGLILCGTFASNPVPCLRKLRPLIRVLPISGKLFGLIAPVLLGRFSTRKSRESLKNVMGRIPASTFRKRLRAVLDVNVSDKLKEIHVPILYLQAKDDRLVPRSALSEIKKICPDMHVVILNAPHLMLQTLPFEAAKFTSDFLKNIQYGDASLG